MKWNTIGAAFVLSMVLLSGFDTSRLSASEITENLTVPQVESQLKTELQDGSLIMHQGDCLAVKVFTASPFTHVGMAIHDDEVGWLIYDSANGSGVRKSALTEYLHECAPNCITVLHPNQRYEAEQLAILRLALEEQIGRPYGIRHHVTGSRAKGVHCAEYMTDTLIAVDLITAEKPSRVSPKSLRQGLLESDLYAESSEIELIEDVIPLLPAETWCGQMWQDTKSCVSGCYTSCRRSIFCCD